MMIVPFLFQAGIISLSGVMAPGPLTAVTLGKGTESPHAGALIALGHGIIEIPLMVSILLGFGHFLESVYVKDIIALIGGIFLLVMGIGMIRDARGINVERVGGIHSPMVTGILLSAGNPYFLIWWVTVGATLIVRSIGFGLAGFIIFAVIHWLCDFLWCYGLSAMSFKGGRFFGCRFQKTLFVFCGVFLFVFSGKFILEAAMSLLS